MKRSKRIAALVVSLALMLSLVCIDGFAVGTRNKDAYAGYDKYLCIGDSIAAGCGLSSSGEETVFDQNDENWMRLYDGVTLYSGMDYAKVPTAYHSLVADAIGAELLQGARSGLRAIELRYFLGEGFHETDETCSWDNTYFDVDGNGFTLDDLDLINAYVNYPALVAEADVISLNLGSNDVFSQALAVLLGQLYTTGEADPQLQQIKELLNNGGSLGQIIGKLVEAYETMGKLSDLITALTEALSAMCKQFADNFDVCVNKIYEINPDAVVIGVGAFNPFAYFTLSEDFTMDISGILTPVLNVINNTIKSYESKYDSYHFADVIGTETYPQSLSDPMFWEYMSLKVHPNLAGHRFMAEQIINAIPTVFPFVDVDESRWSYEDIKYAYDHSLMFGVDPTHFDPTSEMTRCMIAAVLYRIDGEPDVTGLSQPFADVAPDAYYNDPVIWAYNNGIIHGFEDGLFHPDESITREQFCVMVFNYAVLCGIAEESYADHLALLRFADSLTIGPWAVSAMSWCVNNGIIYGDSLITINPRGVATREQCAAMLARFAKLL